ncbi:MAG: hypothetical protein J6I49_00380 [Bacteroidales bacterium]|nr:hypothetical protein [Bacteroidales bacterium]
MKKIMIICAGVLLLNFQFSISSPLRAQGFDWHRFTVSIDYSTQSPSLESLSLLQGGSGIFAGHPYRSIGLGVGYRLWGHLEAGLYANYMGASATSGTGSRDLGGRQSLQTLYREDSPAFGWGATVQLHLVPYKYLHEIGIDISARLGFEFSGIEADNFWFGMGFSYWISKHVSLVWGGDFGSFRYSRMENALNGSSIRLGARLTMGVQIGL